MITDGIFCCMVSEGGVANRDVRTAGFVLRTITDMDPVLWGVYFSNSC